MPRAAHDAAQAAMRARRYSDGAFLWRAGDLPTGVHALKSGRVRLSATSSSGKRFLFCVARPGTLLGYVAALDGHAEHYDCFADGEVVTDFIDAAALEPLLAQHPQLWEPLMRQSLTAYRLSTLALQSSLLGTLEERLAGLLTISCLPFGKMKDESVVLEFNQNDVSEGLGMSRESVVKQIRRWREDGLISTRYRKIVVLDLVRVAMLSGRADLVSAAREHVARSGHAPDKA